MEKGGEEGRGGKRGEGGEGREERGRKRGPFTHLVPTLLNAYHGVSQGQLPPTLQEQIPLTR